MASVSPKSWPDREPDGKTSMGGHDASLKADKRGGMSPASESFLQYRPGTQTPPATPKLKLISHTLPPSSTLAPSHIKRERRNTSTSDRNNKGFRIDDILFSVANERKMALVITTTSALQSAPLSFSPMTPKSLDSSIASAVETEPASFLHPKKHNYAYSPASEENVLTPSESDGAPTLRRFLRSDSINPTESGEDDGGLSPSQKDAHEERLCRQHSTTSLGYDEEDDCDEEDSQRCHDSKKPRTSFTPDQIQTLEETFAQKRYLNHTDRIILADELCLSDCQIKTWFQNRRMKMKRQYKEAVDKGYLIPFHPYPFPRYSRLTPAHFASAPLFQTRHLNRVERSPSSACSCCSRSSRHFPMPYQTRMLDAERSRLISRSPDVLPMQRNVKLNQDATAYENELREYFDTRRYTNSGNSVRTRYETIH